MIQSEVSIVAPVERWDHPQENLDSLWRTFLKRNVSCCVHGTYEPWTTSEPIARQPKGRRCPRGVTPRLRGPVSEPNIRERQDNNSSSRPLVETINVRLVVSVGAKGDRERVLKRRLTVMHSIAAGIFIFIWNKRCHPQSVAGIWKVREVTADTVVPPPGITDVRLCDGASPLYFAVWQQTLISTTQED